MVSGQQGPGKTMGQAVRLTLLALANPELTRSAMATVTRTRTRVKPERTARLSAASGVPGARRIMTLFIGKEAFTYWLSPLASDFGHGYRLEKFTDGKTYDVHFDP